jgi:hypothetical protein
MAHFAGKQRHYRPALLLIIIPLFVLGSISCKRANSFQGYDGTWWPNTPLDQRLGFVEGFLDCYTYGCRKESRLCAVRDDLEPAITLYYAKHREDESMLVGEVLVRVAKSSGAISIEGSESPKPAQETEAFDGLVWLKYSAKKRLGFVEGYLNALMPQTSRSAIFPKSPEYYSDAVTRFYAVTSTNKSQTGTRDNPVKQPIAEVLWGMRNQGK